MELTGATSSKIDFPNFDVATTGNITVQPNYGLDTNASGTLALGNTTAATVNIGNTATTTIAIGTGGALTRAINIGTGTGADTINIGTGATGADVIAIGGGAGTLAINTGDWDISTTGDLTGIGGITADQWSIDSTTGNIITAGDLAVNGGDITTSQSAFNLLNTTANYHQFRWSSHYLEYRSSSWINYCCPRRLNR